MLSVIYLLVAAGASDQAVPHSRPASPPVLQEKYLPAPPAPPPSSPYYAPPPAIEPNMAPRPKGNPGSWVTSNDYPTSSLRAEKSGATAFDLAINKWGVVSDCVVTESSGDAELDEAACRNVAVRAKFYPATDKDAKPIAGSYKNRVRWIVPKNVPNVEPIRAVETLAPSRYVPTKFFPRSPIPLNYSWNYVTSADYPTKAEMEGRTGTASIDLAISKEGLPTDCKITESSGHADLDSKTCEIAMQRARFNPALDVTGNPAASRVSTGIAWFLRNGGNGTSAAPYVAQPLPKLPQPFKESGFIEIKILVKADGTVGSCEETGDLMKKKGGSGSNACTAQRLRGELYEPYLDANGKPVAKMVTVKMSVDILDPK